MRPSALKIICLFAVLSIRRVHSTHFFGGTISWHIENVTNNGSWIPVRLIQTYWWDYNRAGCTNISISTNQSILVSAGSLICSPSCPPNFGSVSTLVMCKDASVLDDNAVGERSDVIWIPVNSRFSVLYASSAWGGLTLGGGGSGEWSILSYIDLVRRSDTGLFNNAPTVAFVSPLYLYVNEQKLIKLSVDDVDGDTVRCRWALSNNTNHADECGSVCAPNALPSGIILHSDCTVELQGLNMNATYAIALMVTLKFFLFRFFNTHLIHRSKISSTHQAPSQWAQCPLSSSFTSYSQLWRRPWDRPNVV